MRLVIPSVATDLPSGTRGKPLGRDTRSLVALLLGMTPSAKGSESDVHTPLQIRFLTRTSDSDPKAPFTRALAAGLDQLNGESVWILDHDRARVAEGVRFEDHLHACATEPLYQRAEVSHLERDVVEGLTA